MHPKGTCSPAGSLARAILLLRELYLLTLADVTTTSPGSMTSWKRRMLDELYVAAERYFAGAPTRGPARSERAESEPETDGEERARGERGREDVQIGRDRGRDRQACDRPGQADDGRKHHRIEQDLLRQDERACRPHARAGFPAFQEDHEPGGGLGVTRPHRRGFPCWVRAPCAGVPPPMPRRDPWSVSRREG